MNIIISGASRGIGKAIALKLAGSAVHRIVLTGRNEPLLKIIASNTIYNNILTYKLDLESSESESIGFTRFIRDNLGSLDILINNAGSIRVEDFMEFSLAEARSLMEVNFFGPSELIRRLVPLMPEGSHIVNIASMGAFQGSSKYKGLSYYSAAKAALACLTECLAVELSDRKISVNCLAPGAVQTEMLEEAFPGYKAPVSADEMGSFIAGFALTGHRCFNGKIIPVAISNP
jgi:NAD(P)-dependent dehydrogenase (short-subunit alcohol dehydrogenase family)